MKVCGRFFSDREHAMKQFIRLLQIRDKTILSFSGEGGMGKSLLLQRMIVECMSVNVNYSLIDMNDITECQDPMSIMRSISKQLGDVDFQEFLNEEAIHSSTDRFLPASRTEVTTHVSVGHNYGTIIGIQGSINKPAIHLDEKQFEAEAIRRNRLTKVFMECLKKKILREKIVIFIDSLENSSSDALNWLSRTVIKEAASGTASGLLIVMTGRYLPDNVLGSHAKSAVNEIKLKRFEYTHIVDYLMLSGIPEHERGPVARMIITTKNDKPLDVAIVTERYKVLSEEL